MEKRGSRPINPTLVNCRRKPQKTLQNDRERHVDRQARHFD